MKIKNLLHIGSIVLLKNGEKKLMIIAFYKIILVVEKRTLII